MSKKTEYMREYREKKRILAMTDKEKLEELIVKIHQLKMKPLLNIEQLEKETGKIIKKVMEIHDQVLKKEITPQVAMAQIKCLEVTKGCLKEMRLTCGLLLRDEGRLQFELQKLRVNPNSK